MKKVTDMTRKEIEAELISNTEKWGEYLGLMAPIKRKLTRLSNRDKELQDQIAKIKAAQKNTDWAWLLYCDRHDSSMEKYNLREKELSAIGLRSSGFVIDNDQVQVQVALTKNEPKSLTKTLEGLKKILKYIKPLKDGFKHIDIFEYSLSQHGVYFLIIDEEKEEYMIKVTRYHRTETLSIHKTLKEALAVIQDKYYYDDLNASEEDAGYYNSDNYI